MWHCSADRDQTGLLANSFVITSISPSFTLPAVSTALGFGAEGTSAILKLTAIALTGRLSLVRVPASLTGKKYQV